MAIQTEGLILSRNPFREYDEKILMLTKKLGKIWVFSYGSRSSKSHRGQNLQTIHWVEVLLEVKNDQYLLIEVINRKKPPVHFQDKDFYLDFSNFLKKISDKIPVKANIHNIYSLLKVLSSSSLAKIKNPFRSFTFIFSYLNEVGVMPRFSHCFVCKNYCSDEYFFYYPNLILGDMCKDKLAIDSNHEFKVDSKIIKLTKPVRIGLSDVYILNYYVKNYTQTTEFHLRINSLINTAVKSPQISLDWKQIFEVVDLIFKNS